jgi:hypothetical protein
MFRATRSSTRHLDQQPLASTPSSTVPGSSTKEHQPPKRQGESGATTEQPEKRRRMHSATGLLSILARRPATRSQTETAAAAASRVVKKEQAGGSIAPPQTRLNFRHIAQFLTHVIPVKLCPDIDLTGDHPVEGVRKVPQEEDMMEMEGAIPPAAVVPEDKILFGFPVKHPTNPAVIHPVFASDKDKFKCAPGVKVVGVDIPYYTRAAMRELYPAADEDPAYFDKRIAEIRREYEAPLNTEKPPLAKQWHIVEALTREQCYGKAQADALEGQRGVVPADHSKQNVGGMGPAYAGSYAKPGKERRAWIKKYGKKFFNDFTMTVKDPKNQKNQSEQKDYVYIAPYGGGNVSQFFNGAASPEDTPHFVAVQVDVYIKDKHGTTRKVTMPHLFQIAEVPDGKQALVAYKGDYFQDRPNLADGQGQSLEAQYWTQVQAKYIKPEPEEDDTGVPDISLADAEQDADYGEVSFTAASQSPSMAEESTNDDDDILPLPSLRRSGRLAETVSGGEKAPYPLAGSSSAARVIGMHLRQNNSGQEKTAMYAEGEESANMPRSPSLSSLSSISEYEEEEDQLGDTSLPIRKSTGVRTALAQFDKLFECNGPSKWDLEKKLKMDQNFLVDLLRRPDRKLTNKTARHIAKTVTALDSKGLVKYGEKFNPDDPDSKKYLYWPSRDFKIFPDPALDEGIWKYDENDRPRAQIIKLARANNVGMKLLASLLDIPRSIFYNIFMGNGKDGLINVTETTASRIMAAREEKSREKFIIGSRFDHLDAEDDVLFWPDGLVIEAHEAKLSHVEKLLANKEPNLKEPTRRVLQIIAHNGWTIQQFADALDVPSHVLIKLTAKSSRGNVDRQLAIKINEFAKKKKNEGKFHQGITRKEHAKKKVTEEDFFWPGEFDKMNYHAEPAKKIINSYGPFDESDPRWQLDKLLECNADNRGRFFRLTGTYDRGFLPALEDKEKFTQSLADNINKAKTARHKEEKLIVGYMSDYPEADENTLFWPPDFDLLDVNWSGRSASE